MSISQSLSNAFSGLTAASRAAEIVSNNVSNVATEGYARREIELSPRVVGDRGAGVSVDGVRRVVDQALLRDRRLADADAAGAGVRADFFADMEKLIGTPDDAASLSGRLSTLDASFVEAAGRPESEPRLKAVLDAATGLAHSLNAISDGIQSQRSDAEARIAAQVGTLNSTLAQIDKLNERIVAAEQRDRDTSGLVDQRQAAIDRISSIVPIKQIEHEYGRIELQTTAGAKLVDRGAATIGFERANVIVPASSYDPGNLSGLTIDGRPVEVRGDRAPLGGGSLAAEFERRDVLAPQAQAEIDAVARSLVARFSDSDTDPSLAAGAAGLFTDAGGAFDPATEVGLAGRLAVNEWVDPSAPGGALHRLRDGVGAPAAPGPAGSSAQLGRFSDALNARLEAPSGSYRVEMSLGDLAATVLSGVGAARQSTEAERAQTAAQAEGLKELQLSHGVDTDQEMQKLLLIEQAYSANARVMSVADQMIRSLLEI